MIGDKFYEVHTNPKPYGQYFRNVWCEMGTEVHCAVLYQYDRAFELDFRLCFLNVSVYLKFPVSESF